MFGRSIDLRFCCSNAASDTSASHIEQVGVPTRKLIHPSSTFPLSCNAIWRDYCQTSSDTTWHFAHVKVSRSKALWGHVMSTLEFCTNICGSFCCFIAKPVLKPRKHVFQTVAVTVVCIISLSMATRNGNRRSSHMMIPSLCLSSSNCPSNIRNCLW